MNTSEKSVNAYNDTHMHRFFWGSNFEYYRAQLNRVECRKWNWAAFFLSIPWLISKQLYKKAALFTAIGFAHQLIEAAIEHFRLDFEWIVLPLAILYLLGVGIYIGRNANTWVIEHFKEAYGDGSNIKKHGVKVRVGVFFLFWIASVLLNLGFDFSINAIHSIYVYSAPDAVNVSLNESPCIESADGTLYWATETRHYEPKEMSFFINRINADGSIKSEMYETDKHVSWPSQSILFESDSAIFHFMELIRYSNDNRNRKSHILLYKWDKELTDYKKVFIDGSQNRTFNHTHNQGQFTFSLRESESVMLQYAIDLKTLEIQIVQNNEVQEAANSEKETRIALADSDVYIRDIDEVMSGRVQIYSQNDILLQEISYDFLGIGNFQEAIKYKNYILLFFNKTVIGYSISEDKIIKLSADESADLYKGVITEEGFLLLSERRSIKGTLYISGILFTGNQHNGYYRTIEFPFYTGATRMAGLILSEPPRIFLSQDSYILMYRTDFDTVSLGRLAKDFTVIPFNR